MKYNKNILTYYGTIFFAFFCILAIEAQQTGSFSNIQYITSDNGLSQSEITTIHQGEKGFLWVGTRGGLNRYDGSSFKIYQNEIGNPNSLINNSIETLFEDSKGYLWIGTKSNGISRYSIKYDRFEHFQSKSDSLYSLHDKRIISINESATGDIWAGSWQNGFKIFDPIDKTIKHKLANQKVNDILKASNGNMWVATATGIYVYSETGERLESFLTNKNVEFTSIVEDINSGNFYLGTWNEGLFRLNPKTKEFKQYKYQKSNPIGIKSNNTFHLYFDSSKKLWIGTWGSGVFQFDPETEIFTSYSLTPKNNSNSELYNDVLRTFQDDSGILWFGTNGGGICKVDKSTFQFGHKTSNLPNEPIWSILKDQDDVLWIGIKGNENIFYSENESEYSNLKVPNIINSTNTNRKKGVKVIFQDLDGILWFADNNDLFEIDKTPSGYKPNPIDVKYQLKANQKRIIKITQLYQTSDSAFWIGTQQNGIRKSIRPGNPKNQSFVSYLENDRISATLEDRSGNFWVGSYGGLLLFKPETNKFIRYSKIIGKTNSLSSDIIICLHEDMDGNIWVGTPNGLNLVITEGNDTLSFKSFQEKDGLPSNYIQSILEDDSGNIWISTNKGISQYNKKKNSFYNYDVNDGLQSNTYMENAGIKDANGKFYFAGIHGLNIFHPDSIKNRELPKVILTGLKISGKEIKPAIKYDNRYILEKAIEYNEEITLAHSDNVFSIDYTILDFHSSSKFSYMFMMEGLDDDWQGTTTQKNVTYSNLDAGTYEFKVKAITDNTDDNPSIARLKINILPPYWQTWQAFVLYILLFIGLLYLYSYIITQQSKLKNKLQLAELNKKREEELATMKTRFFTDIAHEIRTPLSLISGPLEIMMNDKQASDEQLSYLTTIQYHSKRLLNLISQLLDFRKVESGKMRLEVATGNIVKFTQEIFLSFKELAESKNILYELEADLTEIPLTYDRDKMEIVVCNLLSNAFKYSKSRIIIGLTIKGENSESADFSVDFPNGYCEISVKDDGQGISEDAIERIFDRFYQISNVETTKHIGTGIGLALVKNIVELHEGKVFATSKLSNGSTFIVKIPLGTNHFKEEQFIVNFKKSEDPIHYQVERVLRKKTIPIEQTEEGKDLPLLLIIEDNPEIRLFIKKVFEENFKIKEAENGEIGFEMAVKFVPEIIISDVMMPIMDGLTLCNKLKKTEETLHIPIILLTARTAVVFEEKGYNSGADIYVTKPFHPSILRAQVEGLLSSRIRLKDYFSKKITLQPTETDATSIDQEFLNRVMKLVEDNLNQEGLNREFLATNMAVSPSTLYRKIKSITGSDITAFIRSIRLKRAAQMMKSNEDNISGIAYRVGFSDPKYLRIYFKKQFGMNPSEFIKNNKKT